MNKHQQDPAGFQIGDKVKIRSGSHAGARGVIQGEDIGLLHIRLEMGEIVNLTALEITNFSLAARRAWETMPKKAGRPSLDEPRKRMVSLRLDVDVLEMLEHASAIGIFPNKSEGMNQILRENLKALVRESK
jgi:uncharacterized protein (DUF4415 family)